METAVLGNSDSNSSSSRRGREGGVVHEEEEEDGEKDNEQLQDDEEDKNGDCSLEYHSYYGKVKALAAYFGNLVEGVV